MSAKEGVVLVGCSLVLFIQLLLSEMDSRAVTKWFKPRAFAHQRQAEKAAMIFEATRSVEPQRVGPNWDSSSGRQGGKHRLENWPDPLTLVKLGSVGNATPHRRANEDDETNRCWRCKRPKDDKRYGFCAICLTDEAEELYLKHQQDMTFQNDRSLTSQLDDSLQRSS